MLPETSRTHDHATVAVAGLVDGPRPPPGPAGSDDSGHRVDPDVWRDHVRYAERRDPETLARLVDGYDRYACSLAARMQRGREPRDDLDQVAREALVLALNRFDPARRLPFAAFATPTILGSLRRHYRDRGWLLRVPRMVHELTTAAHATTERLTMELGRTPTVAEVADAMNVDLDDLLMAQEAAYARDASSLDAPSFDGHTIGGRIGVEDHELDLTEDRVALIDAMETIDDRGRQLLRLYYFEDCTQAEIGRRLGISQMQVSRLIAGVLRQLRNQMAVTA